MPFGLVAINHDFRANSRQHAGRGFVAAPCAQSTTMRSLRASGRAENWSWHNSMVTSERVVIRPPCDSVGTGDGFFHISPLKTISILPSILSSSLVAVGREELMPLSHRGWCEAVMTMPASGAQRARGISHARRRQWPDEQHIPPPRQECRTKSRFFEHVAGKPGVLAG